MQKDTNRTTNLPVVLHTQGFGFHTQWNATTRNRAKMPQYAAPKACTKENMEPWRVTSQCQVLAKVESMRVRLIWSEAYMV